MEREPDGTLITLLDEDGVEREFEHLASLEHEGTTYVALVPAYQEPEELVEGDGELVILKIAEDEDGEEILTSIDDDGEFDAVAHEFEEMLENDFDIKGIEDEDEEIPEDEE
jgi:Protein of unknown function (DUF1292).